MKGQKLKLDNQAAALFCTQSAMVLKSGISLYEGMEILQQSYENTPYHSVFEKLSQDFMESSNFYESLYASEAFDPYLLKMVQIGEMTGELESVLENLARYYEKQQQLSLEIKNALTYPMVLIAMMSFVILILLVQVLPVFERVYRSLGLQINETILMGSRFATGILILIVLAALLFLIAFFLWKKGKKEQILNILCSLFPFVGKTHQKLEASQFAEVLSMIMKSGYSIEEACDLLPQFMNSSLKEKAEKCSQTIQETGSVAKGLVETNLFSKLDEKLIETAEKTGTMDEALQEIAKTNMSQATQRISSLVSLIEPCLIGILSLVIGSIMLSVMLPLANVLAGMM